MEGFFKVMKVIRWSLVQQFSITKPHILASFEPFVLSFLEQGMDPPSIALHQAQRHKMPDHRSDLAARSKEELDERKKTAS